LNFKGSSTKNREKKVKTKKGVKNEKDRERKEREEKGNADGRPSVHICGYATDLTTSFSCPHVMDLLPIVGLFRIFMYLRSAQLVVDLPCNKLTTD